MNWYEKLSEYFPIEELKSKAHMEALLKERSDIYHKDEGKHHILMFAEFESFIFVDYLYVSKDARGQELGGKLIAKLKKKNKPILLEVEPVDEDDADTEKRLRFYQREHFKHAQSIGYRRRSLATNEVNKMEILYWSPKTESEEEILEAMKQTYENIHTYKDEKWYGESYEKTDEVLTLIDEEKQKNIFDELS
ncbi:GNAT family N-acetyltransferase [Bacillus halotolerans]|uniref:GNAT family N-acetyltransferase n=1 Tax=Bacillus halotolerans TaxID=260554 RepID=UPI000D0211BF|nr:GNAT family N-acetyltransferase [Bacillus halotolerans]PRP53052.1 GNAT family N-acetyltransferase [Bacillus halotolerans]PRP58273.1 GNAT family N-acetyltransferase [Bacillus halotolerans]PRP62477.1 GNAT family N-acetyltransferase [Bacillus halotolerans]